MEFVQMTDAFGPRKRRTVRVAKHALQTSCFSQVRLPFLMKRRGRRFDLISYDRGAVSRDSRAWPCEVNFSRDVPVPLIGHCAASSRSAMRERDASTGEIHKPTHGPGNLAGRKRPLRRGHARRLIWPSTCSFAPQRRLGAWTCQRCQAGTRSGQTPPPRQMRSEVASAAPRAPHRPPSPQGQRT